MAEIQFRQGMKPFHILGTSIPSLFGTYFRWLLSDGWLWAKLPLFPLLRYWRYNSLALNHGDHLSPGLTSVAHHCCMMAMLSESFSCRLKAPSHSGSYSRCCPVSRCTMSIPCTHRMEDHHQPGNIYILTLYRLNCLRKHKNTFAFSLISRHWDGTAR